MNELIKTYLLIVLIPLIFSNGIHMYLVKKNFLKQLAIPIHNIAFGKNKTWRGLILVPLINSFFTLAINNIFTTSSPFRSIELIYFGNIFGLIYMLSELPNSYFKRRMGILSGESKGWALMILDKMDSSLGVSLIAIFIIKCTWNYWLIFFLFNVVTHVLISLLLLKLKIKSSF